MMPQLLPVAARSATYRLQFKAPGQPWRNFDTEPLATESEAWAKLAAWERYAPRDRWRWVRR